MFWRAGAKSWGLGAWALSSVVCNWGRLVVFEFRRVVVSSYMAINTQSGAHVMAFVL